LYAMRVMRVWPWCDDRVLLMLLKRSKPSTCGGAVLGLL
jgi:hypothetical protein